MPLKKPGSMAPLNFSLEKQKSFSLSDTGSFAMDSFVLNKNGITQSPLTAGDFSALRLEELRLEPKELGRGASSKVYLARHMPTGKSVAVKVLQTDLESDAKARRLVLNEVKMTYAARSDHLITFYDAFLHEGAIYLALEYMDYGSLDALFHAFGTPGQMTSNLPEQVLAQILFQVLQGLTYLHKEQHSVHRDLKPANVLINSAGYVKLSDFGISKQLGSTQAHAGTYCGTAAYMSPERIQGEAYSYASDVWSFGLIALEGVCGCFPYPSFTSHFDLVKHIVSGPPPTAHPQLQQQLAPDLLEMAEATLHKDPARRPDVVALCMHAFLRRHAGFSVTELAAWLRASPGLSPSSMEM